MKLGPKYDPKEIESEINSYLERIDQRSLIENELLSARKLDMLRDPLRLMVNRTLDICEEGS